GITDPGENSPCLDSSGAPVGNPALRATRQCTGALAVNPDFNPDLLAFDLSRRGTLFAFSGEGTIKQQAAYIQDDIKAGDATFKVGVRFDHYDGLPTKSLVQPRGGVSYAIPGSGT